MTNSPAAVACSGGRAPDASFVTFKATTEASNAACAIALCLSFFLSLLVMLDETMEFDVADRARVYAREHSRWDRGKNGKHTAWADGVAAPIDRTW